MAFQAGLGFEGLVDRFDDLPQRFEERGSATSGLTLAGGARLCYPGPGEGGFEVAAVVVLVADQDLPGAAGDQAGLGFEDAQQHLPLIGLGSGQGEHDGQAARRGDQVQPSPQKNRECEAQYPYGAQPARSGRLTVSRDRPHSTGGESTCAPASSAGSLAGGPRRGETHDPPG